MISEAPIQTETPAPPTFNELVAAVTDGLGLLVGPDAVVELRALKCPSGDLRKRHTRSGFFDSEHREEMARQAVTLSRDGAAGVYFTLNPVHRDLLSRRCNRVDVAESGTLATDANTTCRRWMFVDLDPNRIADVSSTDAEKASALQTAEAVRTYLRELGWPGPILADSGNGYHVLYPVELPVDDGGLIERCLKALAARFDNAAVKIDTKVYNPSRIVKLYGTVSRKGDHTPERPHRRSRILETPVERIPVPIALLESLAATAPAPAAPPPRSAPSDGRNPTIAYDRARKYLATLPVAVSGKGGHLATFRAACAAVIGFDLTSEEAYPLLAEWNQTHCQPPWDEHELRHKLEDADKKGGERGYLLKQQRTNGGAQGNGPHHAIDPPSASGAHANGVPPTIDADNRNLEAVTAQAWAAIDNANHPPFLYRYGGLPGRIEWDDHDEPIIRPIDEDRMRHVLARAARWTKKVGSGDKVQIVDALPPRDVVKDVLATPNMPLPVLKRMVAAPVFASDGTLQTNPGYHPASRTLYIPQEGFQVPIVSEQPSIEEVDQARSLFYDDLLVDFPFTDEAERAHALALLLLPFARDLIAGATPLHMFEKPMPGTGATLLVDMLSYPATGRPIPTMTEGRDEDEWRKRLTAKLRTGPQYLLIDNLQRRLDSGSVAAAITSPIWEDRLLGQSDTLRIHVQCGWLATANNPVVSSEMARRIIRIRLDAKVDRPWLRKKFKYDLRVWSRKNRGRLVWAALTLIRAWIAAGRPPGTIKLGMFEGWSEVMGGILEVAGIHGFLMNLEEFYDESDGEGAQWRSFVAAWWSEHQARPTKVTDLFELISDDVTLPLGDGSDHSRKVRLGQLLTQARDRIFDVEFFEGESQRTIHLCLRRGDMKKRAYEWKLEENGGSTREIPVSPDQDSPHTHRQTHQLHNPSIHQDFATNDSLESESGEPEYHPSHMRAHARTHTESGGRHSPHSPHSP